MLYCHWPVRSFPDRCRRCILRHCRVIFISAVVSMSIPESVFIGCRVKIISKANIRYEGDLFSIGADENQDPVLTLSKGKPFPSSQLCSCK